MLTRVLAIEWGSDGVRVNAIVPVRSKIPKAWRGWRLRTK